MGDPCLPPAPCWIKISTAARSPVQSLGKNRRASFVGGVAPGPLHSFPSPTFPTRPKAPVFGGAAPCRLEPFGSREFDPR